MSAPWLLLLKALISFATSISQIFRKNRVKHEVDSLFKQRQKAQDLKLLMKALKARRKARQLNADESVVENRSNDFDDEHTKRMPDEQFSQKSKYQRD